MTSPAFHHSPADPDDYPVPVGAAELAEWAVWTGLLADWLAQAGPATAADFDAHFTGITTSQATAGLLDHLAERIGDLLDTDQDPS